jgi:hypothetical protein
LGGSVLRDGGRDRERRIRVGPAEDDATASETDVRRSGAKVMGGIMLSGVPASNVLERPDIFTSPSLCMPLAPW